MALTDENGGMTTTMLVSPAGNIGGGMPYPYPIYPQSSGGQGGNNGFGQDGWWIVLLIILLAAGGWGNNNNGGGSQGGMFGGGMPYVINADSGANYNAVQRGFDQAAIMTGIGTAQTGIQNLATQLCNCCCDMQNTVNQGFNGVQQALCSGFAGVNQGVAQGFAQAEIAANGRQMANMNQQFAAQTAMAQGFNQLGSQFADCCCENRLATADLRYTIATENCADRATISEGIRDLLTAGTANTQRIVDNDNANYRQLFDWLCQKELRDEQRENANLRQQLQMADFRASQIAQTAQLERSNGDVIEGLYNRLVQCPVPSQPVYGSQPIFTCPNNNYNNGCGCGCGGNGNF